MIHVGFTGTQRGMTVTQHAAVTDLLRGRTICGHHGDCVGADEDFHEIVRRQDWSTIVIHPPVDRAKRAFCAGDGGERVAVTVLLEKPYLERNRDIVDVTVCLIATPKKITPELRSGTWSTIRYAAKVGRPYVVVGPAGLCLFGGPRWPL